MKIGTLVKVSVGKGHFHEGEYLGIGSLGNHRVGVLKTSLGIEKKADKKYISIFNTKLSKLVELK